MVYNLTGMSENVTGFGSFLAGTSDVLLGGWLGTLIIIGVGAIMLINMTYKTTNVNNALMVTLFVCFIISVLFRIIGLSGDLLVFILLIGLGFSVAFHKKE